MKTFAITISAISLLLAASFKQNSLPGVKMKLLQIHSDWAAGTQYLGKVLSAMAAERGGFQQARTGGAASRQSSNAHGASGHAAAKPRSKYQGQYPEGSERKLVAKDVQYLTPWGRQVMISEIYARHGLIFRNGPIRNHFRRQKWYRGKQHNVDKLLTPLERENLAFLKENK